MSYLLPPIDTWERWSATFNDVRLWRPVVEAICAREGIAYRRIEAPESSTNAVFILDRQVVVHGDLNAEHLLLDERGREWTMSGLIDFGDARIGVPDYEWMPLWLGLCKRDAGMMRAILQANDPALLKDGRVGRRIAAWTLLHDFGTDAIAELFENTGASRPARSLQVLRSLVWPAIWSD